MNVVKHDSQTWVSNDVNPPVFMKWSFDCFNVEQSNKTTIGYQNINAYLVHIVATSNHALHHAKYEVDP